MRLTRVTLTGADDSVDPRELVRLSSRYPWVEWGILFSASRQGNEPRYPSFDWVERRLMNAWYANVRLAAHICGGLARDIFEGRNRTIFYSRRVFEMFARVQMNGFSLACRGTLGPFYETMRKHRGTEFILQLQDDFAVGGAYALAHDQIKFNVSGLWDQSGGQGVRLPPDPAWPEAWPRAMGGLRMGYAGGINADNVAHVLREITAIPGGDTWIDLETGCRTPDGSRFDLRACEAVLEAAAPFVAGARPPLEAGR